MTRHIPYQDYHNVYTYIKYQPGIVHNTMMINGASDGQIVADLLFEFQKPQ